jgi:hypothetical protein
VNASGPKSINPYKYMTSSTATEIQIIDPQILIRNSTDIAGICKQIVLKTSLDIQGKKYVRVEGWMSIATAHGCVASARDVEKVEGGFRAIGEIRRMSDGVVLSTAEGFVGEDEPTWFGGETEYWDRQKKEKVKKTLPRRPDYAIRAMCQTRAISRACRTAFAHVVVLMDAGLSTTPAEEVPAGGFDDAQDANRSRKPEASEATQDQETTSYKGWRTVRWHLPFGKMPDETLYNGWLLGDLYKQDPKGLRYWIDKFEPKEYKGKIAKEDKALRAALDDARAELDDKSQRRAEEAAQDASQATQAPPPIDHAAALATLRDKLDSAGIAESFLIGLLKDEGVLRGQIEDLNQIGEDIVQKCVDNFYWIQKKHAKK